MPDFRKVYFSFHYDDVTLAAQIRKCDVCFDEKKKQSFGDWADWESVKKASPALIKRWIRDQMKGASVTVVLIGSETASREWVKFEIEESVKNNMGLVGIHLNNMIGFLPRHRFPRLEGANPFRQFAPRDEMKKIETQAQRNALAAALLRDDLGLRRPAPASTLLSDLASGRQPGDWWKAGLLAPPPTPSGHALSSFGLLGSTADSAGRHAVASALLGLPQIPPPPSGNSLRSIGMTPPPQPRGRGIIDSVRTGSLANEVETWCWVNDDGYENISNWIERAARVVGR